MRFTLDSHPSANLVTHVGPDGLRVRELRVTRSVILSATEMVLDWPVTDPGALTLQSLAPALELNPEILVLGTGPQAHFPEGSLFAALAGRGIGMEVMNTAAACRTYNILVNDERPVVAALILP
jgi:uncharacterized protein